MRRFAEGAAGLKRWSGKKSSPIGLDIGSRHVKVIQFQTSVAGEVQPVSQSVELPPDIVGDDWRAVMDQLTSLISPIIDSGRFIGRQVVGSVPDGLVHYRNLRLPPMSGRELELAVQDQVTNQLDLPANQFKTQFFDAGVVWDDDERRQEIIVVAVPLTIVSDLMAVFTRCGLTPVAIDSASAAAARSVASSIEAGTAQLILDIGYRWTALMIAQRDKLQMIRRLDTGLGALDQEVAKSLRVSTTDAERIRRSLAQNRQADVWPIESVTPDAAKQAIDAVVAHHGRQLVQQISRCLQYYSVTFRDGRPQSGMVLGGGASEPSLVDVLNGAGGVTVRSVGTLTDIEWVNTISTSDACASGGSWAVAVGLARYLEPDQVGGAAA